jgi:malonate transporter and related proteins
MMKIALFDVAALIAPVFLLIVAGYWARASGFIAEGFWAPAEKLGYWVLLPSLIVDSLATNTLTPHAGVFALAIAITIVLLSAGLFLWRGMTGWPATGFGSVHQGTLRLNGLLAIAVTLSLLGTQAFALIGVLVATWIPFSNALSVYGYVVTSTGPRRSGWHIAKAVITNPMVFAVIVGVVLNLLGLGPFIDHFFVFELLGRAALPVGLLAIGASLELEVLRTPGPRIAAALVLKLLAMPALMAGLCYALEASPLVSAVAVLCAAMPSSPSGYLVAKQLGGDPELMATIITLQTLVSMVTVTLWGTYAVSLMAS